MKSTDTNTKITEIKSWVHNVVHGLRTEHDKLTASRDVIAKELQEVESALATLGTATIAQKTPKKIARAVAKTGTGKVTPMDRIQKAQSVDNVLLDFIAKKTTGVGRSAAENFLRVMHNVHPSSAYRSFDRLRKAKKIKAAGDTNLYITA